MSRPPDNISEAMDGYTAFATREWLEPWLEAFGDGQSGIWQSSEGPASGIAYRLEPLTLGPFRIPSARGATNDHTPRYDSLGTITDPAQYFARMLSDLGASLLCLDYVPQESHLMRVIGSRPQGLWFNVDFCEESPYVNCEGRWNDYWASRGSTRSLWERRERKLLQEGAVFQCLETWEEIEPLLPVIYEVEASGWKGREGSAIMQQPQTLAFYNKMARRFAQRGWLRLFVLRLHDEIVAFQFNILYRGVLTQLKVGYQERYSKWSPGQVLQLQLLRWAFEQPPVHVYDMLGGGGKAAETKRKWANGVDTLYTIRVFRRNLRGLLAWGRWVAAPYLKHKLFPSRRFPENENSDGHKAGEAA